MKHRQLLELSAFAAFVSDFAGVLFELLSAPLAAGAGAGASFLAASLYLSLR